MASGVKGLVVEIGGDTSGLQKALSEATKITGSLDSELRKVNKSLKLDPTSLTLATQKSTLLKEQIKETSSKLDALKKAQKEADNAIKNGTEISADKYRALEREISDTEAKIKTLKSELKDSGASGFLQSVSDKLGEIAGKVGAVGKEFTTKLTLPIVAAGTAGIKYNIEMEKNISNITTLLGGNADAAKDMLDYLTQMGKTTPYQTNNLLDATKTMLGFGISAEDAQKNIQILGDIAMGDANKLNSLTLAFSQMSSTGKLTGQDLLQMINAGFNPLQQISKETGKSIGELKEEMADGAITSDMVAEAFQHATQEGGLFYKGAEKGGQTLEGKLSTALEGIQIALGKLTETFLPVITKIINKIIEWTDKFASLDSGTQKVITTIALVLAAIGPLISIISGIITVVQGLSVAMSFLAANPVVLIIAAIAALVVGLIALWNHCEGFRNFVTGAVEFISNIVQTAVNFVVGLFNKIIDFLQNNFKSVLLFIINPFAGAFNYLYEHCEGFRNFVNNFLEGVKNAFHNGIEWIKNLIFEKIPQTITNIINWFNELPSKLIETGKNAIMGLIKGFTNPQLIWDAIKNVCSNILDGIKSFFGIASPSKLLEKEVGKWLPAGIGKGITLNTESALKAVDSMNNSINDEMMKTLSFNENADLSTLGSVDVNNGITLDNMTTAFEAAINRLDLKVYVDRKVLGEIATEEVNQNFGEVV